MSIRKLLTGSVLLILLYGNVRGDWWTWLQNTWNEFQTWAKNNGTLYVNTRKSGISAEPWTARVSGRLSTGIVPRIPKKYTVVKGRFPFSIYASCGAIGFDVNINDWVDFNALKQWLIDYATNALYIFFMGLIYSNNTIATVVKHLNDVNNYMLQFQAAKCTRQWMDFAQSDEFRRLSVVEKACVSALYASGNMSMQEALDRCSQDADRFAMGNVSGGLPEFLKELQQKSCYDVSDLDPDAQDFFRKLFGYFEQIRDVARDSAGNPYWSPDPSKSGYIVKWHPPQVDTVSLLVIDSTFRRQTYDAFMEIMRILQDTNYVGGNANVEWDSLTALVNSIVLPGSYLSLSALNDIAHMDPLIQRMVGMELGAVSGIYAIQMLIDRAWQLYYGCKGDNSDKKIPEDDLKNFRSIITYYEDQVSKMIEDAQINNEMLKNPVDYLLTNIARRKGVVVTKALVESGEFTEFRDMPAYGGAYTPQLSPP